MANSRNDTPNTPTIDESELEGMKVADLRDRAKKDGVPATSTKKKAELIDAIVEAETSGASGSEPDRSDLEQADVEQTDVGGAGPDGGRARTGKGSSKTLKYSQEITDPDEEPERAGRSLVTTSHDVIMQWADERGGVPATVRGTEHGDLAGVLRFDFTQTDPDPSGEDRLEHIGWDEWFATFDERRLNFIYQEQRSDGRPSTFFRLENPDREDA
ncbi:MAG TPA: Rho termination factor N-terminal domain-containing protein [Motilibacteraceae bacterium]|nr:Rho termination factor N-terminal domain-containing protein [Motilibacteraceae bacterium]